MAAAAAASGSKAGFDRAEMYSEVLKGKADPPSVHVFLVHSKALDWPKKLEDVPGPVADLKTALGDIAKLRVTAVEGLPGVDSEGDVLVFPPRIRVRKGFDAVKLKGLIAGKTQTMPGAVPLTGPQVMVCAHATRDLRCAVCGPELASALTQALGPQGTVRKCAHIGGHIYAGNAIVFRASGHADWLSYVTPKDAEAIRELVVKDELPHALHRLWRGRMGMSDAEHIALVDSVAKVCESCSASGGLKDVEDLGASGKAKQRKVVFVLGGPGSGKGTQCDLLKKAIGALHLSAGELLRQEAAKPDSPVGKMINEYIHSGRIVPVDVTVGLLLTEMDKSEATKVLVDGFPRNMDNLLGWDRVVGNKATVTGVLFLDAPEDVMVTRLLARARNDDSPETIRKRLATFRNETMPIINSFHGVTTIRADQPIEKVFAEITASDLWSKPIARREAAYIRDASKLRVRVLGVTALLGVAAVTALRR